MKGSVNDMRIRMFEDTHLMGILVYIYDSGQATRTQLYNAISTSAFMKRKIQRLIDCGLVAECGRSVHNSYPLKLTDKGKTIVKLLIELEGELQ